MRYFVLFLMLAGVGFGAYDSSDVDIVCGGFGIPGTPSGFTDSGPDEIAAFNWTGAVTGLIIDSGAPIRLPDDGQDYSISEVSFVVADEDEIASLIYITYVWDGTNITVHDTFTSTYTFDTASQQTITETIADGQLLAKNGELLGLYITSNSTLALRGHNVTSNYSGTVHKFITANADTVAVGGPHLMSLDDGFDLDQPLALEIKCTATAGNDNLFTATTFDADDGGYYNIPYYDIDGVSNYQWIIIEDCAVPDNEDLLIELGYIGNSIVATHRRLLIDFTQTSDTLDADDAVDKGGGEVEIVITGHSFVEGMSVTIAGTTNYDNTYAIVSATTNAIVITETYNAESFGGAETIAGRNPYARMQTSVPATQTVTLLGASEDCDIDLPDSATTDTYNVYIAYSDAAAGGLWSVWIQNEDTGVGLGGGSDTSDIQTNIVTFGDAYLNRSRQISGAAFPIKTGDIKFNTVKISQATGAAATVGDLYVARSPIIAFGDSIATQTYVGQYLSAGFTESRYLIDCAVGGTTIAASSAVVVSMQSRYLNGPVYMPDAVLCLVAGPGINDLNAADNDQVMAYAKISQIAGGVGGFAGLSLQSDNAGVYAGGQNDVIMCSMLPYFDGGTAIEKASILTINNLLESVAYSSNIPYADVYGSVDQSIMSGAHPHATDAEMIADKMAEVYENDSVPSNPFTGGSTGGRLGGGSRGSYPR